MTAKEKKERLSFFLVTEEKVYIRRRGHELK